MYHQIDISDSDIYNLSMQYQCGLKDKKENYDVSMNCGLTDYSLSEEKTHMRCFIEPVLEQKLKTDTFDTSYKCGGPNKIYKRTPSDKVYSTCLGYDCHKEDNDFMYELDDYNTYHNYPVCKYRDDEKKTKTCCPENTQIFYNLTRRNVGFPYKERKENTNLDKFFFDIPDLKYNKCRL